MESGYLCQSPYFAPNANMALHQDYIESDEAGKLTMAIA